jgi:hypothetical protein
MIRARGNLYPARSSTRRSLLVDAIGLASKSPTNGAQAYANLIPESGPAQVRAHRDPAADLQTRDVLTQSVGFFYIPSLHYATGGALSWLITLGLVAGMHIAANVCGASRTFELRRIVEGDSSERKT